MWSLLSTDGFMPHGHCYLWEGRLVSLHVVSDSLIALAYFSIPLTLLHFLRRKRDVPFNWVFLAFGIFILACGTTHVMEIWTVWNASYWLAGWIKAATAAASAATAIALFWVVPNALELRTPSELEEINGRLQNEIDERRRAEQEVRTLNTHLEKKVNERTAELTQVNEVLKREIATRLRAEESLSRERNLLRTLIDHLPDCVYVKDRAGRYILSNRANLEFLQIASEEELVGRTAFEVFPQQLAKHHCLDDEHVLTSGEAIIDREEESLDSAGILRFHLSTKLPLFAAEGTIEGVIGLSRTITERRLAEQALRRSQQQLAGVIGSAMDAIITVDSQQHVVLFNAAAEKMFGWPAEQALGQPLDRFIPERFRAAHQRHVDRFGRTNVTKRSMGTLTAIFGMRCTGEEFPIEASISQVESSGEKFYTVILRDITERERAEQRFRQLIEHAPHGMVMVDREGKIALVNAQIEESFGHRRDELLGQPVEVLVPHRFRTQHTADRKTFITCPTPRRMGVGRDLYGLCKNGCEFPIEIGLNPLQTQEGVMIIATVVDITERKRAEKNLRESEDRLQTVVDNLAEGLIISTIDGQLLHWNRAGIVMHGFSTLQEGLRKLPEFADTFELLTLEGVVLNTDQWPLARVLAGNHLRDFEVRVRRRHEDWERIFSYSGEIVHGASGGQLAFLAINDITERKRIEEEICALNAVLEQRVADRTAQLQAANKELEAFSYSVSHDLRAPLRAIDGFSQALLEDCADKLDEEGKGYLEQVRGASQEMAQLIDALLHLARVTRSEMRWEPVDLSQLAQAVVSELRRREPERKIVIKIAEGLTAQGDRRLLRVLMNNLLGNAWKFTTKLAHPEIVLGFQQNAGEASYFVRDNGAGFDMAYASKLFGAFQRLHGASEFEGTGIGLATVQRIVHRHGGRVWAEGVVNRGATFYFTLSHGKEMQHGEQSDLTG